MICNAISVSKFKLPCDKFFFLLNLLLGKLLFYIIPRPSLVASPTVTFGRSDVSNFVSSLLLSTLALSSGRKSRIDWIKLNYFSPQHKRLTAATDARRKETQCALPDFHNSSVRREGELWLTARWAKDLKQTTE